MINSFVDVTTYNSPLYIVGPLLNLNHGDHQNQQDNELDVIIWLDDQSPSLAVFLCFDSVGAFNEDQVKDIVSGLQNSGYRFLWSLCRPPPKGMIADSSDYTDFKQVLPQEFLYQTSKIGKIIGWAPQGSCPPYNRRICISLWMEFYAIEYMVWCPISYMANIYVTTIECI